MTSMQELLNRHVTLVENHIRRVSDNAKRLMTIARCRTTLICQYGDFEQFSIELRKRAIIHDKSKLLDPEIIPYAWLTEYHRRKGGNHRFEFPEGVEKQINEAKLHHYKNNRHHPEFFKDVKMIDRKSVV